MSGAQVVVTAPTGTTFTAAGQGATLGDGGSTVTWSPAPVDAHATRTLVLESRAATLAEIPTLVWRNLSTTAKLTYAGGTAKQSTSHGPKVIPSGRPMTPLATVTAPSP